MPITWGTNGQILLSHAVSLLMWISGWSCADIAMEHFVPLKYHRFIVYAVLLLISILIVLLAGDMYPIK